MRLCINPKCSYPDDPNNSNQELCQHCGSQLLLENRYRVINLVSEEGFGRIYEVDDRGTTKLMKVLLINDVQGVSMFQREAAVLSQLSHPGIPKVARDAYFTFLPHGRPSPLHCLVLEKVVGVSLEDWVQHQLQHQSQLLSQEQAVSWLKYIVEILDQIHHHLYFHRDIHPRNILLTPEGRLVLTNFGCGREIFHNYLIKARSNNSGSSFDNGSDYNPQQDRSFLDRNQPGSSGVNYARNQEQDYALVPGYTPPEQVKGRAVPQSDYFSLGRTFVYLLTGRSPEDFMEDPRTGELLWQHRSHHISPAFTDVIDYLMATLPGNRPHNSQMIFLRLSTLDYAPPEPIQEDILVPPESQSHPFPAKYIAETPVSENRSTERALLRARVIKRRQQFNYADLWQQKERRRRRFKMPKPILTFLLGGLIATSTIVLLGIVTEVISPDWVYQVERQFIWQRGGE